MRGAHAGGALWLPFWALVLGGCGQGDDGGGQPATTPACAGSGCAGTQAAAGSGGTAGGALPGAADGGAGAGAVDAAAEPVPAGRPIPPACAPDGPTPDALGAVRGVLYRGPRALGTLAVRKQRLFTADPADGILRMSLSGSPAFERVVAATVDDFLAGDLNLYYVQDGGLWKAAVGDTDAAPDAIAPQLAAQVSGLRYDASHLYFADPVARVLQRIPIAGGALETLQHAVQVNDAALQSGFVYYADALANRVQRVAAEGGAAEPVAPVALSQPTAIATDGVTLYWADAFELVASTLDDPESRSSIGLAGPGAGGRPARVRWLELAGERLYFLDDGGNLGWTATDGSACALLVKAAGDVRGADVDADGGHAYLSVATATAHELWQLAL